MDVIYECGANFEKLICEIKICKKTQFVFVKDGKHLPFWNGCSFLFEKMQFCLQNQQKKI